MLGLCGSQCCQNNETYSQKNTYRECSIGKDLERFNPHYQSPPNIDPGARIVY